MVQTFRLFLIFLTVAVHVVGVPGCAVASSATGAVSEYERRCTRAATSFQQLFVPDGPQARSSTSLLGGV